jgi:hypothetical protein
MKKWKYFSLEDKKEEAIGVVQAEDVYGATKLAASKKQLYIYTFLEIYGVKPLNNE